MSNADLKCAFCGADVVAGDAFCQTCGKPITDTVQQDTPPAQEKPPAPITVYVEPPTAFASGLPAWSIEPPAVVVRRKVRI